MGEVDKDAIVEAVEAATGLYYGIRQENGVMKRHGFLVSSYQHPKRDERGFRIVMTRAVTDSERNNIRLNLARNFTIGQIVRSHPFNFHASVDSDKEDTVQGCSFEILEK